MQQTKEPVGPALKDLPAEFTGLRVGVVVKGTGMCQACQTAMPTEK